MSDRMKSIKRAAVNIKGGQEILDLLTSEVAVITMKDAVKMGYPPIGEFTSSLERIDADFHSIATKQFIGKAVRAIMDFHGYEVDENGVRIVGHPYFKSGTTYRKSTSIDPILAIPTASAGLLERFVEALRPHEVSYLKQLLQRK